MMVKAGEYSETATLHRSTEAGVDHLVFEGTAGWRYRVYDYMVTEEELPKTIRHLRDKSWMSESLLKEFEAEALLLRERAAHT